MAKKQASKFNEYITALFTDAGFPDKAKKFNKLQKTYAKLIGKDYEQLTERIQHLSPDMFASQLKDALKVAKGYYKNADGEYMHMCGIEIYGNTSDLCRMGYNGEDRGVFPHWVLVDDHSITRIESPVIGFTKYFNRACVSKNKLMHPTTKEDFEQAVQRAVQKFLTPYEDPDGIAPEQFLDWTVQWIAYQKEERALVEEAMKLSRKK